MAFKFVAFAALMAVAQAGVISTSYGAAPLAYTSQVAAPLAYTSPVAKLAYAAPIAKAVIPEPYDANPQYQYAYGVDDHVTGDSKSQQEQRSGDVVQGSYSLIDSDGFRRTVDYTADPIHGFNAVVRREPLGVKVATPVVAKVAAPLAYHAPIAKYASPLGYAAAPAYYH